jgi:RHS repeat-associated protein
MGTLKKYSTSMLMIFLILLMPITYAETFNFTYDDNGNLINSQYFSYEYNSFNQLEYVYDSVGNLIEEYTYDHEGNRIKKIEYFFDGTNETTYYPFKEMTRKVNDNGTEDTYYYFLDGQTIARDNPDGSRYYYHNDHLGSHSVVTDENGDVVEETEYLPFGKVLSGGDADFLYTGKELDGVGTYYFGARYMDPTLRQFTQPDTIIPDIYDPQSLNRYSYVLNNPYKYVDEDGHNPVLMVGGIAFLTAATIYWVTTPIDHNNPQWGNRLLKGSLHGLNWGVNTALITASGLTFAGGILRFAAEKPGKIMAVNAVGELSGNFYDALIDQEELDPVGVGVNIAQASLLPFTSPKMAGQFASKNLFTKQNMALAVDEMRVSALSELSSYSFNQAYNNLDSENSVNDPNSCQNTDETIRD